MLSALTDANWEDETSKSISETEIVKRNGDQVWVDRNQSEKDKLERCENQLLLCVFLKEKAGVTPHCTSGLGHGGFSQSLGTEIRYSQSVSVKWIAVGCVDLIALFC